MGGFLDAVSNVHKRLSDVLEPTPLQYNQYLSDLHQAHIWLKREDLSPVRSYKIRGAYSFLMQALDENPEQKHFACASAGNHAQGFAHACRNFKRKGVIFMPQTTPQQKIMKTSSFGAPNVEIRLIGDGFDASYKAAQDYCDEVGALMVLDCIASGCAWVDMSALGVDVLISAPQKGWSAQPCAGLVMLSERAVARLSETTSDSFAIDLGKWHAIMQAYLDGGHAYHATMPTDALRVFRDTMLETKEFGFERLKEAQWQLGEGVREMMAEKGIKSVAADGYGAPGVVVSYTDDPDIKTGKAFMAHGMQIAAGVPLQLGEPDGFSTFRLGLFGLDKLYDVEGTLGRLKVVADKVL